MSAKALTQDAPTPFEELLTRYERLVNLGYAGSYLHWDQQVMMPPGGAPGRSGQLSALSATRHELLVDDAVADWLAELEDADLTDDQAACVREIARQYDRAASVPSSLVEEITRTAAENQQIWQDAKADDDFESFAPRLETLRDLQVERATHIDPEKPPYEVMYEDSFPYLGIERVEAIFDRLREALPPLIDAIRDSRTTMADPFDGPYPEADQQGLSEAVLDLLGYDRDHGRLDTAPHPFMTGSQFDARVTTRFKKNDPMDALTATIHEYGHASYQLGLPRDAYGTPLGESRGSIHESQSRFWENHIGRTKPFWEIFASTAADYLGIPDLTAREVHQYANRVDPNNLIRVEADELTYHMHIILRCEIDRAFVNGDIDVMDIPTLWNDKMEEYLGVRPETDTEGCLQDIHWTSRFAAFQVYTLGSVVAAQLDRAVRDDLDVDKLVRARKFGEILGWMEQNIHRHGQRYETPELVERAAGEPPTAEPFVEYVEDKFTQLYDL